jgi:molecular chaperone GrpE
MQNDEEQNFNNENEALDDISFVESTEDGEDSLSTQNVSKKLREEIKTLRKEKEEYLTGWQRAKADYINLQKDMDHVRVSGSVHTKEKFLKELLPALDSFDMAFINKEAWESVDENWRKGVEYIYQNLITGLNNLGIEKIDKVGDVFDPNIHHGMETIETKEKEKDHTIESIIQVGYFLKDNNGHLRVIRPAKVNVYQYLTE